MDFKQGNTYKLLGHIENVNIDDIDKVVFKFNDIVKTYQSDGTGDVQYSDDIFTINLSQQETLSLNNESQVKYEVAVKFKDAQVKRSQVYYTNSLETIIQEAI